MLCGPRLGIPVIAQLHNYLEYLENSSKYIQISIFGPKYILYDLQNERNCADQTVQVLMLVSIFEFHLKHVLKCRLMSHSLHKAAKYEDIDSIRAAFKTLPTKMTSTHRTHPLVNTNKKLQADAQTLV